MKENRGTNYHSGICVRRRLKRALALLLAALMVISGMDFGAGDTVVTAMAATLDSNLLSNPNGETVSNGTTLINNGWLGGSQGFSALGVSDYATSISIEQQYYGKDITSVLSTVPHSGSYYMSLPTAIDASIGSGTYSCYQDVDISGNAADIDNDSLVFSLSGWLCATGGNTATISLKELDANKNVVTTSSYEKSITTDAWTQVTLSGALKAGVRYLEVTISGTHLACGLAAFDDLSLRILSNTDATPVLAGVSDQTMVSGTTLGPLNFSVSDSDTSFSNLTISAESSNTWLIPNANISTSLSNGTGTVSLSAISGRTGQSTITVSVSDGVKTAVISFVVTVNPDVQMDTNLIVNGTGTSLSGWADSSSRFYSSGGAFTHTWEQAYYMYQDINISKYATLIDAGFLTYTAAADVNSSGAMQVIFRDSFGSEISTSSGANAVLIPVGTRSVRVNVGGTSGCTIDNVNFTVNSTGLPRTSAIADQSVISGNNTGNLSYVVGYAGSASITATSSNTAVVPATGISLAGSGYLRTICVTPAVGMSGSSTITISVNGTAVTSFVVTEILPATKLSVTANGDVTSIQNGSTLQLNASVVPANAEQTYVTWSVVNETGSATISNTGILTATGVGTVTVRATSVEDSNVFGTMQITIQSVLVSDITVTAENDKTSIQNEDTIQMAATVLPGNAENQNVAWYVENETGSAIISQSGLLTATGVGTVTVKAEAVDGSGVVGTLQMIITAIPVSTILVTGADQATTVRTGSTMQMTVAVEPSNATDGSVTWSVENGTGSATISDTGLLSATEAGTITVKAVANDGSGIVGILPITICNALVNITQQPDNATVTYGYAQAPILAVTAQREAGVTAPVSYQWYRSSTNTESQDEKLLGATSDSYTVESGLSAGTFSYYCSISCGDYIVNSNIATITVNKAESSIVNHTYQDKYYYTGNAITAPAASDFTTNRDGVISFTWYNGASTADEDRLESAPIGVGTYTLKAEVAEMNNYTAASTTVKVIISYLDINAAAVLSGILEDNGWYTSDVTVSAPENYSIAASNGSDAVWGGSLTVNTDSNGAYTYYLKQISTGYITDAKTVTVKRDATAPELGTIAYSEHHSFLDWLFHRERIDVTIPVTDAVSGADHISYVLTPDVNEVQTSEDGAPQAQTASVDSDGNAVFTVEKNFVGTIAVTAYDKAGNATAQQVIAKLAVEDTAPTLTVNDGTDEFTGNYYTTAQTLHISASDAESGLQSVTYTVDGGSAQSLFVEANTDGGLTVATGEQTITAQEGTHTYVITATDNALNTSTKTVTIHQDTVAPTLNYVISPASSKVTDTTAAIKVTASEAGSLYYLAKESGTAPTMEELFATTAHDMVAGNQNTISLSNLKCNTAYTIYVAAKDEAGNQTGTITELMLETSKTSFAGAEVTLTKNSENSYVYNGTSQIPDVTVSVNGTTVDADQYDITYSNSNGGNGNTTDAGTVTVTVNATEDSNYTGTATASYVITRQPVEVTIANATKQYGQVNPPLVLEPIAAGQLIGDDTIDDLHITLSTTAGTVSEAGSYPITGTGSNANYEVTVNQGTLTITKIDAALTVPATAITKTYGDKAFTLGAATAGTAALSYQSSSTGVATVNSAGTVTIKGCGITTITVTAAGTSYNPVVKTITLTVKPKTMATPSLKSTTGKKLTVTWKKDSKVSGYQIAYSTSSKFTTKTTKTVTVKSYKTLTKAISKLKSGKKYYVHIRSYKSSGNTTVYSGWSKTASVKVK